MENGQAMTSLNASASRIFNDSENENQRLQQELRGAREIVAALCFQKGEPLCLYPIDFLHTRDATLFVTHTLTGNTIIHAIQAEKETLS